MTIEVAMAIWKASRAMDSSILIYTTDESNMLLALTDIEGNDCQFVSFSSMNTVTKPSLGLVRNGQHFYPVRMGSDIANETHQLFTRMCDEWMMMKIVREASLHSIASHTLIDIPMLGNSIDCLRIVLQKTGIIGEHIYTQQLLDDVIKYLTTTQDGKFLIRSYGANDSSTAEAIFSRYSHILVLPVLAKLYAITICV
jgi:hypothetical protein